MSLDQVLFAPVRLLGALSQRAAIQVGGMSLLLARILRAIATGRVRFRDVIAQAYTMGVQSIPLVCVTGILSGVVTSMQGGYQFTSAVPLYVLGSVVTSSVVLELGPVMTAFVLIGRVGARITAELGTMQVSEQIDALYSLGRDPVPALAAPRLIAGTVTAPLLVGLANLVGFMAGIIAARATTGLGHGVVPVRSAPLLALLGPLLLADEGDASSASSSPSSPCTWASAPAAARRASAAPPPPPSSS